MAQIRQVARSPYPIVIEEVAEHETDETGAETSDILRLKDKLGNTVVSFDSAGTITTPAWSSGGDSTAIVLRWDPIAADYLPLDGKASDRPKEFRGPTNPLQVAGVVFNDYDIWISAVNV